MYLTLSAGYLYVTFHHRFVVQQLVNSCGRNSAGRVFLSVNMLGTRHMEQVLEQKHHSHTKKKELNLAV